jgi:hypothetical protein
MTSIDWKEVTAECDGMTIEGFYRKVGDTVTVKTPLGSKAAQTRGLTPVYLAKMILRELARKGRA